MPRRAWTKRGLIWAPTGQSAWGRHSALQPTPLLLGDIIRVFVGLRDDEGVSRVGFVDVHADDPREVLRVSETPALDIGSSGSFDDNGVVPCAVVERDDRLFLYYAGYQLPRKVRFNVFGGLATSVDGGLSFTRYQRVPVLDRKDDELFFRVLHSIHRKEGVWRAWYGGGSEFRYLSDGRSLPVYNIRYTESADGVEFRHPGQVCIDIEGDEHRVGRPYVVRDTTGYRMFYATATTAHNYRLSYAESPDGIRWTRNDDWLGLDPSPDGWDSEMMSYPSVIRYRDRVYLFYNGNNYGATGFGYAESPAW